MNTAKHRLWVAYSELWRCQVNRSDIDHEDVLPDQIRQGYWLDPNSRTATWLALKGCELLNRDCDDWIWETRSRYFGT